MNNCFKSIGVCVTSSSAFNKLVVCCALFSVTFQLSAGEKGAPLESKNVVLLDLRDFIDRIAAESPRILASRLDVAAADYEARSAYASYLPHLVGEARIGYVRGKRLIGFTGLDEPRGGINNRPEIPVDRSFTQEGPGLVIPVFKEGSFLGINVPPEVQRKRAEREIIKFRGSLTTSDLVLSATGAYLSSIKATHLLELRRQHYTVAAKEAERVENRASDNLATAEELGAARLLRETSRASFEAERVSAVYSFLAVADLLGLNGNQLRIQEAYPKPAALPDFEMVAKLSALDHPKVRLQEAAINGAKANVALQRSRQYPSVKAESFDFQYGDFHGQAANQWVSFMSVSVPVFDFGEAAFATRSASVKMRAESARLLAVRQDVRKELLDAFVELKQTEAAFAKANSDVAEQERIANRLREQAKVDQALLSDLNSAELKLLDSKEALEQAHYDVLFQYARVQRVSAGAWEWVPR
ncbi:MAG: TolC family protein [Spartobacteria bacterium]